MSDYTDPKQNSMSEQVSDLLSSAYLQRSINNTYTTILQDQVNAKKTASFADDKAIEFHRHNLNGAIESWQIRRNRVGKMCGIYRSVFSLRT